MSVLAASPGPTVQRRTRDEAQAFRRYRATGDTAVRDELIERALPLAHQVARRYHRSGETFDDLLQVARLGLCKAVERFDPERELAFSTYAVPTMVGEIKRHFRDTGWAIHVPRSLQERALKVEQATKTLSSRLGRAPTVDELAEATGMDVELALEALEAASAYEARSLDAPAPGDDQEGRSYVETLGRRDDGYELVDDRGAVADAMRTLPLRERRILHMRFMQDMTQSEIAERVGVSQMQVSRLLRRSLSQLREHADADPQPPRPTRAAAA
ncbi:MAG TPA: SigB/SigF/SigG family RNA polymerase sigma factor [Solirubrobacteraceae bacterium]|nr:SigB/SigF/SigG family RNA polymerase sigma factor [Solirubrobacteraceae bacterium]